MVIIRCGQMYLAEEHEAELANAPHYVRDRYLAVVQVRQRIAPFTMAESAAKIGRSVRQLYRYLARFKVEGVRGLFDRSRQPKTSPRRTPPDLEDAILRVRRETGLGQDHVARLVGGTTGRTVHRVLARHDAVPNDPRATPEWRRFEWPRPDALIQADITLYNGSAYSGVSVGPDLLARLLVERPALQEEALSTPGVQPAGLRLRPKRYNGIRLLTCQDDHSRHAWVCRLRDEDVLTTYRAMKHVLPARLENLLTDNGHQFARDKPLMRQYRLDHVRFKHIHARSYHPQTLGKLGAYQKALKRFLDHVVGDATGELDHWMRVFTQWYHAGRHHRGIRGVPDDRYHARHDPDADRRFLAEFNIDLSLPPLKAGD